MKKFLALLFLCILGISAHAATGRLGPYTYGYDTTPVGANIGSIDPVPGSVIINNTTGARYYKFGASGTNSNYFTQEVILDSGTTAVTLSGTAVQTITIGTIPAIANSFVFTRADVLCLTATSITAAPTYVIQSGTATLLTGTATLTGTTANTLTTTAPATAWPLVAMSGTARNIELRTITTGTATVITGRIFVRGFLLP